MHQSHVRGNPADTHEQPEPTITPPVIPAPATWLTPRDAWIVQCLIACRSVEGVLDSLTIPWKPLGDWLVGIPAGERETAWNALLSTHPEQTEFSKRLAAVDPSGDPPEVVRLVANLSDVARNLASQPWLWPSWIPSGCLTALAAEPGKGKTRLAFDLARRLWLGMDWPDGQENTCAGGSVTLWIQADRAFQQMVDTARSFGIPEDAVHLAANPDDPYTILDLDERQAIQTLAHSIRLIQPALVVIDTIGMVTGKNLTKPEEAREFFAPLLELAHETSVPFLALTHVSKEGNPLGRRIVEKARSVIKLSHPDPEGQPNRRRLWVDKTAAVFPAPLGVTMAGDGNSYDFDPPTEPEPEIRRRGPIPARLEECMAWLRDQLRTPARVKALRDAGTEAGYDAKLLYRARDEIGAVEETLEGKKWWRISGEGEGLEM